MNIDGLARQATSSLCRVCVGSFAGLQGAVGTLSSRRRAPYRLCAGLLIGLLSLGALGGVRGQAHPNAHAEILPGTFTPQIHFMVSADVSDTHGDGIGDRRSADFNQPVTLPRNGQQVQIASYNDGYPYNGHAAIVATMTASATETAFDTDASMQLNISNNLFARSGCCGGLHPGSTIQIAYIWASQMDLPDIGKKWRLKVSLTNGLQATGPLASTQLPALAVLVDGQTKSLAANEPYSVVSFDLEPGGHSIQVHQPTWGIGARDTGSVSDSQLEGILSLTVAAQPLQKP